MVSCGFGVVGCGEGLFGEEMGRRERLEERGSGKECEWKIGEEFEHCPTATTSTAITLTP